MRRTRHAATLASLLLSAGCYKYVEADLTTVPPQSYVRVFMTRRGLASIPEGIPISSTYVIGRITAQTRDSLLLQIPVSNAIEGGGSLDLAQNVYVPLAEIVSVDRRQLSAGRTVLGVGAGVAVVSFTVLGINKASGASNETGTTNTGTNQGDG